MRLRIYRGIGAALLAFDVDESLADDLAGFAVFCTPPGGSEYPLVNRLSFDDPITQATTPEERRQISQPTDIAPLQKFHWVHYPPDLLEGDYTYRAVAMMFKAGSERDIEPGLSDSGTVKLVSPQHPNF